MEREPLPLVSLPVSILGFAAVGLIIVIKGPASLSGERELYLSLGAIGILAGPFISQLIYAIWSKFGGFWQFDYSKKFITFDMNNDQREKVQKIFDRYWHYSGMFADHGQEPINEGILNYSRRRSGSALMSFIGSRVSALSIVIYAFFWLWSCICGYWMILLYLSLLMVVLFFSALFFDFKYKKCSRELYSVQEHYLIKNGLENVISKDIKDVINN